MKTLLTHHRLYDINIQAWSFEMAIYNGLVNPISNPGTLVSPRLMLNSDLKSLTSTTLDNYTIDVLHRLPGENKKNFINRRKIAYWQGLSAKVTDDFVFAVMEDLPRYIINEDDTVLPPEEVQDWFNDVDGKGNSWVAFQKLINISALVYGFVHVMADFASNPVKSKRTTPYLYIVTPQELVNFDVDEWGQFIWVIVKEGPDQYRKWTDTQVQVLDGNGAVVSSEPNRFGFIPIETVYSKRNTSVSEPLGVSWLHPIALLETTHFNWSSWKQDILKLYVPIMVIHFDDAASKKLPPNQEIVLDTHSVLPIMNESGIMPQWLQPGHMSVDILDRQIHGVYLAIQKYAGFLSDSPSPENAESVEALQVKRKRMNAGLYSHAREWEAGHTNIGRMVFKLAGWSGEFKQPYPQNYGEATKQELLEPIKTALELNPPEKARTLAMKKAFKMLFPELTSEEIEEAFVVDEPIAPLPQAPPTMPGGDQQPMPMSNVDQQPTPPMPMPDNMPGAS